MNALKEFVKFIKENKFETFVRKELDLVNQLELPLMKFLRNLGDSQVYELTKGSLGKFLDGPENGNAIEIAKRHLS